MTVKMIIMAMNGAIIDVAILVMEIVEIAIVIDMAVIDTIVGIKEIMIIHETEIVEIGIMDDIDIGEIMTITVLITGLYHQNMTGNTVIFEKLQ